ncbi:hypothetical protein [Halorussus lipolyticus]|uniref:hypothetical protein n=1 Tax=Halorussus lipolyticus TaxID=3034024 RepID=UPI0023E8A002|nr:hypothetical protein [Halorussus sp. DT80]
MSWMEFVEKYDTQILVLLSLSGLSHLLSRWIHENYYLLEYIFLILVFGLIHEAWSSIQADESLHDFLQLFGADSKTGMQIALIIFIGSTVFISIQLRNIVEGIFGPLSVVQMLAVIVLLSRAFVNVYSTQNVFAIFDGNPDTYAAYTVGVLAFLISWKLRDHYPAYTWTHNMLSIWPATICSWLLFYHSSLGDNLPNFTKRNPSRSERYH